MKEEELEEEAKQSYLDNTDHMQWDAEGEFDYTRGYLNGAEPRENQIEELKMALGSLRTFSNEQATCIERLENENKKILNDWLEACDKYGKVNLKQQKNKEQLEQAKELLKRCYENYIYLEPVRSEIKQFLLKGDSQMTEELSKGFTGIEINGVKFSNIKEMLIYMNVQRDCIIKLDQQIEKMKVCSNCKHFNKVEDNVYCWNCERHLVNSLDNLLREEIIDEWELKND